MSHSRQASLRLQFGSPTGVFLLIISLAVGTSVFTYVADWRIVLPSNTDWLMVGDAAQHYLGWAFFRHTPFLQFPLGNNPKLGLDVSSSVVFTDSLPLAALIFKPLSRFFGTDFQYFGLWIWSCFVLQAYWSIRILRRFVHYFPHLLLSCVFIVFSPILIYRLIHDGYGHIALASHFLILIAFDLNLDTNRKTKSWCALFASTLLIHAYFVPMIAFIWFANLWLKQKNKTSTTKQTAMQMVIIGLTGLTTAIGIGYASLGPRLFIGDSRVTPDSWNYIFRWQPLSLVDSATHMSSGWSTLLYNQQELIGDSEGFSFLGLGIIALVSFLVVTIFVQYVNSALTALHASMLVCGLGTVLFIFTSRQVFSNILFSAVVVFAAGQLLVLLFSNSHIHQRGKYAPLFLAVAVLAFYSLTNRPGSGQRTWFEYPLVFGVKTFTETFRTHARYIWPAYYLLVIAVLILVNKRIVKHAATSLLVVCLAVQFVDTRGAIGQARERFDTTKEWSNPLTDPYWDLLGNRYENLIVYPPLQKDEAGEWIVMGNFAASYQLGTNSFYFSRWDVTQYEGPASELRYDLILNELDPKSFYIVNDNDLWDGLVQSPRKVAFMGTINNRNIIAPLTEATGR